MIKRLWCWLWGHKRRQKVFSGEYAKEKYINPITLIEMPVPIMYWETLSICPRCGAKLGD